MVLIGNVCEKILRAVKTQTLTVRTVCCKTGLKYHQVVRELDELVRHGIVQQVNDFPRRFELTSRGVQFVVLLGI